ncbi:MAG TPA: hypothetical protein VFY68_01020 [Nitrososphaeraceae archaeon]|nr:hypothetical protein [Nitrososphaeraceae archaeon]
MKRSKRLRLTINTDEQQRRNFTSYSLNSFGGRELFWHYDIGIDANEYFVQLRMPSACFGLLGY